MSNQDIVYIVYDDECLFCRNYCQLLRIRKTVGVVELVDARRPSALMDEITARGLDIDQGMVVKMGDDLFYGAEAIHVLALISTRSGLFNRVMYGVFRSKRVSLVVYPFLRDCRNLALRVMGIDLIENLENK